MKTKSNKILITLFTLSLITTIMYSSISNSLTKDSITSSSRTFVKTGLIYNEDNSYSEIFKTIMRLTHLSEEYILKALELDYVEEELTNIVNTIYEYNLTQDKSVKYTDTDIINLVENNIDKLVLDINYPLTEEDRNSVINYTKNNTSYILNTIYSTDIGNWTRDNHD